VSDPEKVKAGLDCCSVPGGKCGKCPYHGEKINCTTKLSAEARELLMAQMLYYPPVTPGTQIFSIVYDEEDNDRCAVKESKVAEIWYNINGWFFTEEGHSGPAFRPKHIGQVVFLDRDAAQLKCDACNKRRDGHE